MFEARDKEGDMARKRYTPDEIIFYLSKRTTGIILEAAINPAVVLAPRQTSFNDSQSPS